MALTWYRLFQRNCGLNQILRRQTSRFDYGLKASEALTGFPSEAPELIPEF
jgi:hypothetical protein